MLFQNISSPMISENINKLLLSLWFGFWVFACVGSWLQQLQLSLSEVALMPKPEVRQLGEDCLDNILAWGTRRGIFIALVSRACILILVSRDKLRRVRSAGRVWTGQCVLCTHWTVLSTQLTSTTSARPDFLSY